MKCCITEEYKVVSLHKSPVCSMFMLPAPRVTLSVRFSQDAFQFLFKHLDPANSSCTFSPSEPLLTIDSLSIIQSFPPLVSNGFLYHYLLYFLQKLIKSNTGFPSWIHLNLRGKILVNKHSAALICIPFDIEHYQSLIKKKKMMRMITISIQTTLLYWPASCQKKIFLSTSFRFL